MKTPKLTECVGCVLRHLDSLDDKSLEAIILETEKVTTTNCGWQEYRIADITKDYATYVRNLRQAQKAGEPHA